MLLEVQIPVLSSFFLLLLLLLLLLSIFFFFFSFLVKVDKGIFINQRPHRFPFSRALFPDDELTALKGAKRAASRKPQRRQRERDETRERGGGRPDVQGTRSQGYAHTQTQTYKRHKLTRTALTSVCRLYV